MVQSMTGYATCSKEQNGYQLSVEVKSVNNRFFSFSYRSVGGLDKFEDYVRNITQKMIGRGSVNVFLRIKNISSDSQSKINSEIIASLVKQLDEIASHTGISRNLSFDTLLKIPGVISDSNQESNEESDELIKNIIHIALEKALQELIVMRENEGKRLLKELELSITTINKIENELRTLCKDAEKELTEELLQKLNKILASISSTTNFEPKDILKEIALLAEKADIEEEINRIKSHIVETKKTLSDKGPIGKKLDFLCQEFGREFNTICSKTKKIEISQLAINGKLEVEKIREQVQNIE